MHMMGPIAAGILTTVEAPPETGAAIAPIAGRGDNSLRARQRDRHFFLPSKSSLFPKPAYNLFSWSFMRCLSLFVGSTLWLLAGPAQGFAQSTASASEAGGAKSPAFAYVVACLSGLLIMLILCMPSRKR
jgi:hypothetical protein